jgi:hypothetical protein
MIELYYKVEYFELYGGFAYIFWGEGYRGDKNRYAANGGFKDG